MIRSLLYVNFGFGQAFLLAAAAVMLSLPLALYEVCFPATRNNSLLGADLAVLGIAFLSILGERATHT